MREVQRDSKCSKDLTCSCWFVNGEGLMRRNVADHRLLRERPTADSHRRKLDLKCRATVAGFCRQPE